MARFCEPEHLLAQNFYSRDALGHGSGQPVSQIRSRLPIFRNSLCSSNHDACGTDVERAELVEAVRFELTVELPPRQFSRLQP
jgi:hypothetical protein